MIRHQVTKGIALTLALLPGIALAQAPRPEPAKAPPEPPAILLGAMTTLNAALAPDTADRPAFIAPVYGPMLPVTVPRDAPPMFVALALDDEFFGQQGFGLIESWHRAGRPVELHAYERGHHGFALGAPGTTTTLLLDEFTTWLQSRDIIPVERH
jgi:acetyl esterase/lipase